MLNIIFYIKYTRENKRETQQDVFEHSLPPFSRCSFMSSLLVFSQDIYFHNPLLYLMQKKIILDKANIHRFSPRRQGNAKARLQKSVACHF